jgi:two-component system chemotaxis response regulator CheY
MQRENQTNDKLPQLAILAVDDNDFVIDLITFALRSENVSITGVRTGGEALRLLYNKNGGIHRWGLDRRPFTLILTDLRMPKMNGMDFIRAVRASEDYNDVPIIVLSGYEEESYQKEAKLAGASDYLKKPFTPNELLTAVRKQIEELSK